MQALGVTASHPEEARHGVFRDFAQASGGPHAAPFAQMINDGLGVCLRDLRIE
jgi:hypothetical protein